MHPHIRQDESELESTDWTSSQRRGDGTRVEDRGRWYQGRAIAATLLLAAVIVALIVLL